MRVSPEALVTYKKQRACEIMAYVGHIYFGREQCAAPQARTRCVQVAGDELERKTGVG